MSAPNLGKIGVWSMELRFGDHAEAAAAAAELEALGYGALWIPGGIDNKVLPDVERLLAATQSVTIATGILNLWMYEPEAVADWFNALPPEKQSRVMIGVGVSHGPLIGENYGKPLAVTRSFCERLLAAGMPQENLCLAALGPKMLALSGELTAGAHPYLVTPEHSAIAHKILGDVKLIAPEQGVIVKPDPEAARAVGREALTHYLNLPNYCNNWRKLGLTQEDIDCVSDKLVDALFAWGTDEQIAQRINAHYQAGANHVCVQIVRGAMGGDMAGLLASCRQLARVLI